MINQKFWRKIQIVPDQYLLMTMHRPATVDEKNGLEKLLILIDDLTNNYKIVFPIRPYLKKNRRFWFKKSNSLQ